MLRRGILALLSAFLALTFTVSAADVSVGSPTASTANFGSHTASQPIARGDLSQDLFDSVANFRADGDDTSDDRWSGTASEIVWPDGGLSSYFPDWGDVIGSTHRGCAAPPRAPPVI